jgi:hypothetical protein
MMKMKKVTNITKIARNLFSVALRPNFSSLTPPLTFPEISLQDKMAPMNEILQFLTAESVMADRHNLHLNVGYNHCKKKGGGEAQSVQTIISNMNTENKLNPI